MAIYHLHASVVHRSLGHSAVAASAYAAGKDLYNERAGKMEAYGRKGGVYHTQIIAPDNAPQWVYDRQQLWNRAEQAEKRVDAQPARVFVLALPHEFNDGQKLDLVDAYVREVLVSEGMVVDIGMHRADRTGDQRNDHVHLVMTMRELDGDRFSSTKNREWNRKDTLVHWREQWAEYQNRALEEAGFDTRVDHRTLEEQGIDREPTKHLGREATLMERRGGEAELGDINREIAGQGHRIDELVNELAEIDAQLAAAMEAEFLEPQTELAPATLANVNAGLLPMPEVKAVEPEPSLSWEEQKASVDLFNSPMALSYEADIKNYGEIREYGLGKNWFDRTVTMFENIYYDTINKIRSAFEKIIGGNEDVEEPDQDVEDYEPDR